MIRRRPLRSTLLLAVVALGTSACSTFTDTDVVARVGVVEMTDQQLAELLREQVGDEANRAPLELSNQIVTTFVLDAAVRADIARLGGDVPTPSGFLTAAGLQSDFQQAVQAWQAVQPRSFERAAWGDLYARGPADSGIVCTSHVLLDSEAEANDVLAELDRGASFADLAAERSTDPGSRVNGGVIECAVAQTFANSFVPEYVDAAFEADIGEPVGPVQSQFGFHVILVRPFDEIDDVELEPLVTDPAIRFDLATRSLDIYVDPRYGSFEGARGIVSLG